MAIRSPTRWVRVPSVSDWRGPSQRSAVCLYVWGGVSSPFPPPFALAVVPPIAWCGRSQAALPTRLCLQVQILDGLPPLPRDRNMVTVSGSVGTLPARDEVRANDGEASPSTEDESDSDGEPRNAAARNDGHMGWAPTSRPSARVARPDGLASLDVTNRPAFDDTDAVPGPRVLRTLEDHRGRLDGEDALEPRAPPSLRRPSTAPPRGRRDMLGARAPREPDRAPYGRARPVVRPPRQVSAASTRSRRAAATLPVRKFFVLLLWVVVVVVVVMIPVVRWWLKVRVWAGQGAGSRRGGWGCLVTCYPCLANSQQLNKPPRQQLKQQAPPSVSRPGLAPLDTSRGRPMSASGSRSQRSGTGSLSRRRLARLVPLQPSTPPGNGTGFGAGGDSVFRVDPGRQVVMQSPTHGRRARTTR